MCRSRACPHAKGSLQRSAMALLVLALLLAPPAAVAKVATPSRRSHSWPLGDPT
jgi:hypothetical protein